MALRLSAESEGNAQGVGLADVVTRALADAIDPVATYVNTVTSTFVQRAFIPITMPSDRDAVIAALASLGLPVLPELRGRQGITVDPPAELIFTAGGTLADLSR